MSQGQGFTLLELLVTVAVATILMAIAIPSYRQYVISSQRADASTSLFASLQRARSEAITRNSSIILCQRNYYSTGAATCDTDADGSWEEGWLLMTSDGTFSAGGEPDANAEVLLINDPVGGNITVSTTMAASGYVMFNNAGRPDETASFTICATGTPVGRQVEMGLSGYLGLREISTCPG